MYGAFIILDVEVIFWENKSSDTNYIVQSEEIVQLSALKIDNSLHTNKNLKIISYINNKFNKCNLFIQDLKIKMKL